MAELKPLLGPMPFRLPRMPWLEAAGLVALRQAAIESFGAPGYELTLAYPKAEGFAAAPRDFRPVDLSLGRAAQGGRFYLAGSLLDCPYRSEEHTSELQSH